MNSLLKISGFASKDDNLPAQLECSWEQLLELLGTPRVGECSRATCAHSDCPSKEGYAWSPAFWRSGATRGRSGVEGVSALIVDVDHVPTDEALAGIYERVSTWKHFVHASHSDRPGDRCVRVGFAVSRPIAGNEFTRVRSAVLEMLELPGDRRTSDASRLFFLPTRPVDACGSEVDGTGYLFAHGDGKVLEVDAILQMSSADVTYDGEDFEVPEFAGAPELEALRAAAKVLGEAWPDDDRHAAQLALAGALARAGWPVDLIGAFCAEVAHVDDPGNPKHVELAPGSARASYEKVRTGESVSGWPTVIEYCGEEAVAAARKLLGLDTTPEPDLGFVARMRDLAEQQFQQANHVETASLGGEPIAPVQAAAPTEVRVRAAFEAAHTRLARRTHIDDKTDAAYLKRVLKSELIVEPQELAEAAIAVAKHAPRGTTNDQLIQQLMPCAGQFAQNLPEIVTYAIDCARRLPRSTTPDAPNPADVLLVDFVAEAAGEPPIREDVRNFDLAMHRLGVTFEYDVFARRKICTVAGVREIVQDKHINELMFRCEEEFKFYPPKEKFYDYCTRTAHANSYHPVLDYLNTLPAWDGLARVEEWLIRHGGVKDTAYTRAISRIVMVAAVRRVRQPGCKFDEMLILEGEQGYGKSTALAALCPDRAWFTDDFKLGLDTQKQIEKTSGKWIVEAQELKGMSLADLNDMKSCLRRQIDESRMAYGREVEIVPRQFVFIGTTNEHHYLKDPSGDRSYWPVKITRRFNIPELLAERDQLWAEALKLDLEHPEEKYIRLDPELYDEAAAEQRERRVRDAIHEVLEDAFDGVVGRVRNSDVWKLVISQDGKLPNQQEQKQIASAMRSLGFENKQIRTGGSRGTYFIRGDGKERDTLIIVTGNAMQGFRVRMGTAAAVPTEPPLSSLQTSN